MKSLVALVVVICSVIGMVGAIAFLMRHPWSSGSVSTEFNEISPQDISRIEIANSITRAATSVSDQAAIARFVSAFRQAKGLRHPSTDQTLSITFVFVGDRRPPLKLYFGESSMGNDLGPAAAQVIAPYLPSLAPPMGESGAG